MSEFYPCSPYHDTISWLFEPSGCPDDLTTSLAGGVLTVTNPTGGASSGWDRGLFGSTPITTVGTLEFQFIYTLPAPFTGVFQHQFVSLSKEKRLCGYPGSAGPEFEERGITVMLSRQHTTVGGDPVSNEGDTYLTTLSWSYPPTGVIDSDIVTRLQHPDNIYKLTLDGGVWSLYINDLLDRTFTFDSDGDPMFLNLGSSWPDSEVQILRFSNTSVF